MLSKHRIAITTGDIQGIGCEVTYKALHKLGLQKNIQFVVLRSQNNQTYLHQCLKKKFNTHSVSSLSELRNVPLDEKLLVEVINSESPASWVSSAAKLCIDKKFSALVTGPISKATTSKNFVGQLGHTEIFQNLLINKALFMSFWGKHFNLVLATGHIPLEAVPPLISTRLINTVVRETAAFLKLHEPQLSKKPIGLLGLNPHAGELGLIGTQERRVISPAIKSLQNLGFKIEGPLVPDIIFKPKNWKKFSCFIALYHDQGLIPFKMVHHDKPGVHITLGLPFIRTSVDHGTATDILGTDVADASSMLNALKRAVTLARKRGLK